MPLLARRLGGSVRTPHCQRLHPVMAGGPHSGRWSAEHPPKAHRWKDPFPAHP